MLTHPDVQEAAAVALPHPNLGEEVGAVVVLRPGSLVTPEELSAHLSGALAAYERPSKWWLRGIVLPTNATGKLVRREVRRREAGAGTETIWNA